jgi:hypothetical protein
LQESLQWNALGSKGYCVFYSHCLP